MNGCAWPPKRVRPKAKPACRATTDFSTKTSSEREERLEIFIPNGPRLGNKVIEATGLSKAFGETAVQGSRLHAPPAGIVGVIGPNGAGKTTLFRLIMGQEKPDAGSFEVGETVKIAYVDQTHHDLLPEKSVYEVISQGSESRSAWVAAT